MFKTFPAKLNTIHTK